MEQKILEFVSKLSAESGVSNVDLDTHLFEEGVLDSFGLVDLLSFLEEETGVLLAEEDLNDPRFTSVAGIAQIVAEKTAAAGASKTGEPR